jgi:hypothetical protein
MFEDDIPPMPKKTVAKTWDQMTPQEKISGVKGRTVWNEKTRKYYTVFDVPAKSVKEDPNPKRQAAIAIAKKKEQGLNEFALPGSDGGDSGRWYTDDELADIIGDDWFEDFDVSNDGFNIDTHGEKAKKNLVGYANSWFDDRGYNVNIMGVEHNDVDHDLKWYIVGSFQNDNFADKDIDEGAEFGATYAEQLAQKVFNVRPALKNDDDVLTIGYKVAVQDLASQTRAVSLFSRDQDFPSDFVSAYYYLQKQGVSEAEKKGLYYYVNKRKKAGTSRDASSPKAPTAQAWKDAAKTAKKEGVAEDQLNELDMFAPVTTFIKMTDGSYVQADWRRGQGNAGFSDSASFINFKPVNPTVAKQLGLDSHQRNNSISNHRDGTIASGGDYQGSGPMSSRRYEVVDYNKPETMEKLPDEIKPELIKWVQKQSVAEGFNSEYDDEAGMVKNNIHTIVRVLTHLSKDIDGNENLPEWVQEKIAMIKQTSVEVMNYMISQHEMGVAPSVDEAYNNYHANRTGFAKAKRDMSGEGEPEGMFTVMIDGRPWKQETSNNAFQLATNVKRKYPNKQVAVKWPNGQLNTIAEDSWHGQGDSWHGTGDAWHGGAQGEV